MRRFRYVASLLVVFFAIIAGVSAQDSKVRWTTSVEHEKENIYRVLFTAEIDEGWHMYDLGPYEDGPNQTEFVFEPASGIELLGDILPHDRPSRSYDELFGMEIGYYDAKAVFEQKLKLAGDRGILKGTVDWMVCSDTSCLPPEDMEFEVEIKAADGYAASAVGDTGFRDVSGAAGGLSIWQIILAAMKWALLAIVSPCVFPMIPMTVSFFLKDNDSKSRARFRAVMYGIFIIILYTLPIAALILITRIVGGDNVTADIFNWLATHWLPNTIFFLVFMTFAASFFGAFEITMPSKLVNKSDKNSERGGLAGVFFMALTLVLVSFSCTGPLVGSAIVESTSGGVFWTPIITMLAFSLVFALPFMFFAFFPALLNKLPKSGGWLNSVKVVLGFIEVALGFKFLSVADQTYHWGILDREVYLAIWITVFTLMGFYLLGKIRFKYDSDVKYVGIGRLTLVITTFAFVVYMIPGMFGAPLKALSGYLPPIHTQDFVIVNTKGGAPLPAFTAAPTAGQDEDSPKYSDFLNLPHGLTGFFDLEEAQAYADKAGKPLFVDITGHGCVNCREMEARVWSDPRVLEMLRNDYVIVGIYLDDKKVLPESDWITTHNGKVLKGLGKINSYNVLRRYGINAQPYYVIQGMDGEILNTPRGYNLNVQEFVDFLKEGREIYSSRYR